MAYGENIADNLESHFYIKQDTVIYMVAFVFAKAVLFFLKW